MHKRLALVAALICVGGAAAWPVVSSASPRTAADHASTTVKIRAVAASDFRPGRVISPSIRGHVISWQWYRCNRKGTHCKKIPGATHAKYRLQTADIGHILRVRAVVSGSNGQTNAQSVATPVIGLPLPVNVTLPTVSGTAMQGQTLTGSPGTWDYAESYTYQWEDCNSSGASCTPISGATAETYELQSSDVGYTIVLVVTAYNYMAPGASTS